MNYYARVIFAAIALTATTISCSDEDRDAKSQSFVLDNGLEVPVDISSDLQYLSSDINYDSTSEIDSTKLARGVRSHNDFSFQLYNILGTEEAKNSLVYSPLSVRSAFALLYPAVAQSSSSQQDFIDALQFDSNISTELDFQYTMKRKLDEVDSSSSEEEPEILRQINQVWMDQNYTPNTGYLEIIKSKLNAGLVKLPIGQDKEGSRKTINNFISHNTAGLIEELIPEGVIKPSTATVLTNSIYYKAAWANQFEPTATKSAIFNTLDGSTTDVSMMLQTESYDYHQSESHHAVSVNLGSSSISLLLVQPLEEDLQSYLAWEQSIGSDTFSSILSSMSRENVELEIPKMQIGEKSISLKPGLQQLGMQNIFTPTTNHFPDLFDAASISPSDSVFVGDVMHQAKIIFDENGIEAAAATAVTIEVESAAAPVEDKITFKVDRPTLFFIFDSESELILFMGRIAG